MARTLLVPRSISRFAVTPASGGVAGDVANGMWLPNNGATFLRMTSTSPGSQTVEVLIPGGVDTDLSAGPRTLTIPANSTGSYSGFFPVEFYGTKLLLDISSALVKLAAYSFLA